MNEQSQRNDYRKTSYGDYRSIEREAAVVPEMDQATAARIFVNRVYNWMFCGLMITAVIAWGTAKYAMSSEAAMRQVLGLALPLIIVEFILVFALSAALRRMSPATVYSMYNQI